MRGEESWEAHVQRQPIFFGGCREATVAGRPLLSLAAAVQHCIGLALCVSAMHSDM